MGDGRWLAGQRQSPAGCRRISDDEIVDLCSPTLLVAGTIPGHEIEHPMAVVILGGLITSTALNLLVMPALYLRFGGPKIRPAATPAA